MNVQNYNSHLDRPVTKTTFDDGTITYIIDGELTSVQPSWRVEPRRYTSVPHFSTDGSSSDFDEFVAQTAVALCPRIVWEAPNLAALSKVLETMHPDDINGGRVRLECSRAGSNDWARAYVDEYAHDLAADFDDSEPLTAWYPADSCATIVRFYRGSICSTFEALSVDPPAEFCVDFDALEEYGESVYPVDNGLFSSEFADAIEFQAGELRFRLVVEIAV